MSSEKVLSHRIISISKKGEKVLQIKNPNKSFSFGTDSTCQIRLKDVKDAGFGAVHCQVTPIEGKMFLVPLGSVLVNGQATKGMPVPLQSGDMITLGNKVHVNFRYEATSADRQAESATPFKDITHKVASETPIKVEKSTDGQLAHSSSSLFEATNGSQDRSRHDDEDSVEDKENNPTGVAKERRTTTETARPEREEAPRSDAATSTPGKPLSRKLTYSDAMVPPPQAKSTKSSKNALKESSSSSLAVDNELKNYENNEDEEIQQVSLSSARDEVEEESVEEKKVVKTPKKQAKKTPKKNTKAKKEAEKVEEKEESEAESKVEEEEPAKPVKQAKTPKKSAKSKKAEKVEEKEESEAEDKSEQAEEPVEETKKGKKGAKTPKKNAKAKKSEEKSAEESEVSEVESKAEESVEEPKQKATKKGAKTPKKNAKSKKAAKEESEPEKVEESEEVSEAEAKPERKTAKTPKKNAKSKQAAKEESEPEKESEVEEEPVKETKKTPKKGKAKKQAKAEEKEESEDAEDKSEQEEKPKPEFKTPTKKSSKTPSKAYIAKATYESPKSPTKSPRPLTISPDKRYQKVTQISGHVAHSVYNRWATKDLDLTNLDKTAPMKLRNSPERQNTNFLVRKVYPGTAAKSTKKSKSKMGKKQASAPNSPTKTTKTPMKSVKKSVKNNNKIKIETKSSGRLADHFDAPDQRSRMEILNMTLVNMIKEQLALMNTWVSFDEIYTYHRVHYAVLNYDALRDVIKELVNEKVVTMTTKASKRYCLAGCEPAEEVKIKDELPENETDDEESEDEGDLRDDLQHEMMQIWLRVKGAKSEKYPDAVTPFMHRPNKKKYPEYYASVTRVVTMKMILQAIKAGDYETMEDMAKDFRQMFVNFKRFNRPKSPVYRCGALLEKEFKAAMKAVKEAANEKHEESEQSEHESEEKSESEEREQSSDRESDNEDEAEKSERDEESENGSDNEEEKNESDNEEESAQESVKESVESDDE